MKGPYPPDWKFISLRCKSKANFTCAKCGAKEDKKKDIRMTCDHIDGNPANCNETNLRCLCRHCNLMEGIRLSGRVEMKKKEDAGQGNLMPTIKTSPVPIKKQ